MLTDSSHRKNYDEADMSVCGKYPNYQDIARLEYGRLLWNSAVLSCLWIYSLPYSLQSKPLITFFL